MKIYSSAIAWLLMISIIAGQVNGQGEEARTVIERFLDSEVVVVAYADLQRLDVRKAGGTIGLPKNDLAFVQSTLDSFLSAGITSVVFAGGAGGLVGNTTQLAAFVQCKEPDKALAAIRTISGLQNAVSDVTTGGCFVGLNQQAIDWLKLKKGEPSSALVNAAKAINGKQGVAIAIPTELSPLLNSMLGQSQPLTEGLSGLEWIDGWGDLTSVDFNLIANYVSVDAASKANKSIKAVASTILKTELPSIQKSEQLLLLLKLDSDFGQELSKLAKTRMSAMQSSNNMKQLSLALHSFYTEHGCLPPQALMSKEGKPLLSWRVLLLPYLEQDVLYKKFRLDEAWDSPHNLPLANQMPFLFKTVDWESPDGNQTRYLAPLAKNSAMGTPGSPITFSQVTDGTSNTIWLVETVDRMSIVWTKPDDLTIDPTKPLNDLATAGSDRFLAARLDGSVNVVGTRISAETANAFFSINGGEFTKDPRP